MKTDGSLRRRRPPQVSILPYSARYIQGTGGIGKNGNLGRPSEIYRIFWHQPKGQTGEQKQSAYGTHPEKRDGQVPFATEDLGVVDGVFQER